MAETLEQILEKLNNLHTVEDVFKLLSQQDSGKLRTLLDFLSQLWQKSSSIDKATLAQVILLLQQLYSNSSHRSKNVDKSSSTNTSFFQRFLTAELIIIGTVFIFAPSLVLKYVEPYSHFGDDESARRYLRIAGTVCVVLGAYHANGQNSQQSVSRESVWRLVLALLCFYLMKKEWTDRGFSIHSIAETITSLFDSKKPDDISPKSVIPDISQKNDSKL
ncbi:hypothetical protein RFI_16003 [Reticulomyxa filosa]|uniref:Uncharacterized protein n=1 Tax=Reticulomyxa filosa TaxID=46433 RepID=X6N7B1_RETFI|nr:hypothetical protein RFI_16003 [Reticulomyxa filosa]|eukprot:ETO21202.1 hypothetical protein RFI_16003 [Reticulomyxa filosa]